MLRDEGYTRRHPARLNPEAYCVPGLPVGFVVCAKGQRPVLTGRNGPEVIAESLHFNANQRGIELIAWCLMPDHLHFVAQVCPDGGDLLRFLHGFKTWTGRVLPQQGISAPVWQRSFWDRHLRRNEPLHKLVAYVAHNPVEEGLCDEWQQWPWVWLDQAPEQYGLWDEVTKRDANDRGRHSG